MKILVITQYFWPESFKINDLALSLKDKGHDVTILTAIPNYPKGKFFSKYSFWKNNDEKWNGIYIYRCKIFARGKGNIRLMLNYISFVFFCSIKVIFIKQKFDKIFVYEPSPVTVGLPAIIASRKFKAPFYFWVQDLWPESLTAAGGLTNKYVLAFFNWITILIYKKAKFILIQSRGFSDYILNQGDFSNKLVYFPNTAENFYKPIAAEDSYYSKLPKGFKLIFAGNIGEAQGINTLIEAAYIIKSQGLDVQWIFLGDGRQKQNYIQQIENLDLIDNFYFLGTFPAEEMPHFFACADALIVSLKKDNIFSLTIPAKVQCYLASGKPILGSLDGEGKRVINESKAGFVSPAGDANLFAMNVVRFYNLNSTEKNEMKQNGINYFRSEFGRDKLTDRLIDLLNK